MIPPSLSVLTTTPMLPFSASMPTTTQVAPGDPVTLSWDVNNETSLTLDPGNMNVFGTTSRVVNPSATTTYTLTASDGVNTVQDTIEITVSSANPGNSISVNFHSDDSNALADHQLSSGELAGLTPSDGSGWNNINLGSVGNARNRNGISSHPAEGRRRKHQRGHSHRDSE